MARSNPIQASMNAGILSPLLIGNIAAPRRANAMADMQNMIPLKQGPCTRRPGTRYVYEVKRPAFRTALLEFEFSVDDAYVIEAGHKYFRFYRNRGLILEDDVTVTGIAGTTQLTVTTDGAHGYDDGDEVVITDTTMWQVSGIPVIVSDKDATTFKCKNKAGSYIDGTDFTAASGGVVNKVFELASPYEQNDLFDSNGLLKLKYTQSADVMFLVHPDFTAYALVRTATDHISWTLSELELQDGPYLPIVPFVTSTVLGFSGTSGNVIVSSVTTAGINGGNGFQTTDVGRLIRVKHDTVVGGTGLWRWLKITSRSSTTVVQADVKSDPLESTNNTPSWQLGLYSDTTGWPEAITFHQSRIILAGNKSNALRFDGTVIGGFSPSTLTFSPTDEDGTVSDDNAIARDLSADGVNVIHWLKSFDKGLVAGSAGGEWVITPSTLGQGLTPDNVTAIRATTRKSANVDSLQVGNAILFIQRHRRKLRELGYVFEQDGVRTPDMNALSDKITGDGVKQLVYHQEPYETLWLSRDDGALLGFVYERDENVVGWHKHVIGGTTATGNAETEMLAVIPSPTVDSDDLWMIVQRKIGGATKRYVEYMERVWDDDLDPEDAFYVDSGLTYDGDAVTTITGLQHLEGETVKVMRDGTSHPDQVVTDGKITLSNDQTGTKVHVGYGSEWFLETLPLDPDGGASGKRGSIPEIKIRLRNTLGISFGPSESVQDNDPFSYGTAYDTPTEYFTGLRSEPMPPFAGRDPVVRLSNASVFPATVLSIMMTQDIRHAS